MSAPLLHLQAVLSVLSGELARVLQEADTRQTNCDGLKPHEGEREGGGCRECGRAADQLPEGLWPQNGSRDLVGLPQGPTGSRSAGGSAAKAQAGLLKHSMVARDCPHEADICLCSPGARCGHRHQVGAVGGPSPTGLT